MRKIIDDRGRLFGLISLIDVIVLAAVVLLAVAAVMKFRVDESNPLTTTNMVKVEYTVLVTSRRPIEAEVIRPGDALYTEFGTYIGTIKEMSTADSDVVSWLMDGTYAIGKVEGRVDITMIVEAQCSQSDGRYYIERNYELTANTEQRMGTKYDIFSGLITMVKVLP